MDVWMTWTRRTAQCRFCSKPITVGTPIVKGKQWRKLADSASRWCFRSYWHPECWMKEGLVYLETHPYKAKSAGRPRLLLDAETRKLRLKLLMSRARTLQVLRARLIDGCSWEHPAICKLLDKLFQLLEEIDKAGGAPESWSKPLVEILGVPDGEN